MASNSYQILSDSLRAAMGGEDIQLDELSLDSDFDDLGFDSLVVLEAAGSIERRFGISIIDALGDIRTPRNFMALMSTAVDGN